MLGECHAHLILDGENFKKAVSLHKNGVEETVIRERLLKYKEAGVSLIRDGGDCLGVSKRAKVLAEEYGIFYLTPVFAIHKQGHYGGIVGRGFETIREYVQLVKEAKASGADFIKVMISGLIDFESVGRLTEEGLSKELIHEMVHIAHEEGMAVMAHCNGARTLEAAADAGVDSVEHGAYADWDSLQAMKEHGVIWTPTVSPLGNLKGGGRFRDAVTMQITENHLEQVKRFVLLGGQIALGSDAGAWRVPHVEGLWTELQYLKEIVDEEHLKRSEDLIKEKFSRRN